MNIKRIFIYLLFNLCLIQLTAQTNTTKVKIIHADKLSFNRTENARAKKLKGNVQLKHKDMLMFCDSALIFDNQDSVAAFGDIKIVQGDQFQITGDSLFYNNKTLLARLRNNIVLTKPGMQLTTNYLNYDRAKKIAYFENGGKLIQKDDSTTLTAQSGVFHLASNDFLFRDDVKVKSKNYHILADSIIFNNVTNNVKFIGPTHIKNVNGDIYCESGWYNSKTKQSRYSQHAQITTKSYLINADTIYLDQQKEEGNFYNNVIIQDTTNNIKIFGNRAVVFQKNDSAMITQQPVLEKAFSEDTLFLHADTFKIQTIEPKDSSKDKNKILYAFHQALFYKQDMQGKCDSLTYSFPDSMITMYNNPVLWSDSSQMTGDTISIFTYDSLIKSVYLRRNAFIVSQVDSIRFNQIKGVTLKGYFKHNSLSEIRVHKKVNVIYYVLDDKNKFIGVNKAKSKDLLIRLKDNKIKTLTFIHSPNATLYPLKDISPDKLKLDGFLWLEETRPKSKHDIF